MLGWALDITVESHREVQNVVCTVGGAPLIQVTVLAYV